MKQYSPSPCDIFTIQINPSADYVINFLSLYLLKVQKIKEADLDIISYGKHLENGII